MATLNDKVKAFIIQGLASFQKPQEIADAVKVDFGIDITRQQVANYDPTKAAGKDLSEKWRKLFYEYRQQFIDEKDNIPVTHLTYRLTQLQTLIDKAMKSGNMVLAADLLKQAAEDVGGKYTNQQKVDSKVEQTGEMNHKHSIDLPENIADLNAQELAKLYFTKS